MATDRERYPSYQRQKEKMKERYHNDAEYRQKKKEENKKYYEENCKDKESRIIRAIKAREYRARKKNENGIKKES